MTLKGKLNDVHFQCQLRVSQDACLVQIWSFQLKSVLSYHADKQSLLEFYVEMAKMTLKGKLNDLHFQYQLEVSQHACLVQIWWFQLKCVTSYYADKRSLLEFYVKMAKMTLKVVNDLHFQYQLRVSQHACLVQICWFQLKSVMIYPADKVKCWQTQATTITLQPKGQGVKTDIFEWYSLHWSKCAGVNCPFTEYSQMFPFVIKMGN